MIATGDDPLHGRAVRGNCNPSTEPTGGRFRIHQQRRACFEAASVLLDVIILEQHRGHRPSHPARRHARIEDFERRCNRRLRHLSGGQDRAWNTHLQAIGRHEQWRRRLRQRWRSRAQDRRHDGGSSNPTQNLEKASPTNHAAYPSRSIRRQYPSSPRSRVGSPRRSPRSLPHLARFLHHAAPCRLATACASCIDGPVAAAIWPPSEL